MYGSVWWGRKYGEVVWWWGRQAGGSVGKGRQERWQVGNGRNKVPQKQKSQPQTCLTETPLACSGGGVQVGKGGVAGMPVVMHIVGRQCACVVVE